MENATQPNTSPVPFGDESSQVFPGLTKATEVIVWACILVAFLAVFAIILRLAMPLLRSRNRKMKGREKRGPPSLNGSVGQLLGASTPSTASRTSSLSRSSHSDKNKSRDDLTAITTISGTNYDTKTSVYGHSSGMPAHMIQMKSKGPAVTPIPAQRALNQELSSVLSTPTLQRLQSLNLNEVYRDNWDRAFDPTAPHSDSLSPFGHPSESRHLSGVLPSVHQSSHRCHHPELKTHF